MKKPDKIQKMNPTIIIVRKLLKSSYLDKIMKIRFEKKRQDMILMIRMPDHLKGYLNQVANIASFSYLTKWSIWLMLALPGPFTPTYGLRSNYVIKLFSFWINIWTWLNDRIEGTRDAMTVQIMRQAASLIFILKAPTKQIKEVSDRIISPLQTEWMTASLRF